MGNGKEALKGFEPRPRVYTIVKGAIVLLLGGPVGPELGTVVIG